MTAALVCVVAPEARLVRRVGPVTVAGGVGVAGQAGFVPTPKDYKPAIPRGSTHGLRPVPATFGFYR